MKKQTAIVIGGSIAGISCAHALISSGWDAIVIEKSSSPTTGSSATGAGLGLDSQSREIIQSWVNDPDPELLNNSTMPLDIDQNQATDENKRNWTLTRDEYFNFRAAHWVSLHEMLYRALPPDLIMWGHHFLSFNISNDKLSVRVKAKDNHTDEIKEIVGDLLIAADGCMSVIRQHFLPTLKLRYSGYCAWRGVIDCSGSENSDLIIDLHKSYPEFGRCLYFDLSAGTHSVFYELKNKRINWIWYINQPEPELKENSMTMKVSNVMIQKMHEDADKVWVPALAKVMKETNEPFINKIYDMDPLEQLYFDNVVLVGDAAHPTTPHGLRSTNMSILDASVLGMCLRKWDRNNLSLALKEFQSARLPVISKQVLHSRRMGRIKQGLPLPDRGTFYTQTATPEECLEFQQKNMPFFTNTDISVKSA